MTARWTDADLIRRGLTASKPSIIPAPTMPVTSVPWTTVIIPGEPCAQGRPRATAWRNKAGKLTARVYSPAKSARWRDRAATTIMASYRGAPLEGPLEVEVDCIFRCPPSDCRKLNPTPRRWHAKKPDADNAAKSTLDAARGLLFVDDAQVAVLVVRKVIAAQDEPPCVVVRVRRIEVVHPSPAPIAPAPAERDPRP